MENKALRLSALARKHREVVLGQPFGEGWYLTDTKGRVQDGPFVSKESAFKRLGSNWLEENLRVGFSKDGEWEKFSEEENCYQPDTEFAKQKDDGNPLGKLQSGPVVSSADGKSMVAEAKPDMDKDGEPDGDKDDKEDKDNTEEYDKKAMPKDMRESVEKAAGLTDGFYVMRPNTRRIVAGPFRETASAEAYLRSRGGEMYLLENGTWFDLLNTPIEIVTN